MAGNTSKIQLISNALILIGDKPISSLDEAGAGAIVGKNLYDSSIRSVLSMHRWRFASKKAQLSRLAETPLSDYKYQYQIPSDYIEIHRTSAGKDYEIYQDRIYTNKPTLEIDYTYQVSEDYFPAHFVKAFEFFLAAQFAIPVTSNNTLAGTYLQMFNQHIAIAKSKDSMERPSRRIQENPIDAMFG